MQEKFSDRLTKFPLSITVEKFSAPYHYFSPKYIGEKII